MKNYDALLKRVELFERIALYGDRTAFLKSLGQNTPPLAGTTPNRYPGPPEAGWREADVAAPTTIPLPSPAIITENPTIKMPAVNITSKYPSIPKDQQKALSRITTVEGLGTPLKIDGLLGPKTQAAIDAFKSKMKTPQLNNQEVLTWVKMLEDSNPKYKY